MIPINAHFQVAKIKLPPKALPTQTTVIYEAVAHAIDFIGYVN